MNNTIFPFKENDILVCKTKHYIGQKYPVLPGDKFILLYSWERDFDRTKDINKAWNIGICLYSFEHSALLEDYYNKELLCQYFKSLKE